MEATREWPVFSSAVTMAPSPPPPPTPAGCERPVQAAAWNPQTIAWLGLLLSPVWAGIMAAINTRRLHVKLPIWRPIVVSVGAKTRRPVRGFRSLHVLDLPDVCLYLLTLWTIWWLDLRPNFPPL